ncbi:hypothetical protein P3S68_023226 [Capsicum galapagoense]
MKNIIYGTLEHGYACLLAFSHMVELLNLGYSYSIMVNQINGSFVYYFSVFGACIREYAHMKKKLKCAHHGLCMSKHLIELKNNIPKAAHVLENVLSFEKWSRAYFPGNRYDVMTTNITESLNSVLMDEWEYPIILRDNKSVSDSLYVTNENGGLDQFMVFSNGVAVKVSLLERSYSCQKFNLVKMLCEHVMAALRAKYGDDIGYGNSIYEYSLPIYKDENYLLAY